ncbi:MAG TPA: hypothetical protein VGJ91_05850, partial [Polyangiaceae bacterium]
PQPIPVELDAVIERGLRKDPDQRFQSAKEFQKELEHLWQLLHHSHAFATTYFSVERTPALKTTGDLPNRSAEPPVSSPVLASSETSSPTVSANDTPTRTQTSGQAGHRPNLVALSFAVALVTAVAVASGIVALLAKAGP